MKGRYLDVKGGQDAEGRHIRSENGSKKLSQEWDIIYADDMPDEPKKGELSEDFGLYVERPFHIVSQMPGRRYIDVIDGKKVVIKTTNSFDSQVWYFDQVTKTIRNKQYANVSLSAKNSGRDRRMEIYSTSSGWF
jgi:hypothetical protein